MAESHAQVKGNGSRQDQLRRDEDNPRNFQIHHNIHSQQQEKQIAYQLDPDPVYAGNLHVVCHVKQLFVEKPDEHDIDKAQSQHLIHITSVYQQYIAKQIAG